MPSFGARSRRERNSCSIELQLLLDEAIKQMDFSILQGARTEAEQRENVANGVSQTMNSKHLARPSRAVDLAPWPLDFEDISRYHRLAGLMLDLAGTHGVKLTWGGSWRSFKDFGHFELEN